jgi:hypothetical protein
MATKHHHFMLAAFVLAIVALAGCEADGANLAGGETRLPSGVVVRIDDWPSSTAEIKRKYNEMFGATFEETKKAIEALRSTVLAEILQTKLEIVNALNHKVQSICDEYIRYGFLPYARSLPPSLKEIVINASDRQGHLSEEKCVYKVAQGPKITREDGSALPEIALENIHLDESTSISIAVLSEMNEEEVRPSVTDILTEKDILIVVPFATTDMLNLVPYLTRVAQKLYSLPAYRETIIKFLASEKNGQGDTYKSASLIVRAFKTNEGNIEFIESIKYQDLTSKLKKSQDSKLGELIVILSWNLNLAKAMSADLNGEVFKTYISDGVIRDSTEVLDAVGKYAAESYNVSQVVVAHHATLADGRFMSGFHVVFESNDGVWKILNKPN